MFHMIVLFYHVTSIQFNLRNKYDNQIIYLLLRYLQRDPGLLCYNGIAKCYLKGIACNLF